MFDVHFKIRDSADDQAKAQILKRLASGGASRVEPLFPRESDPELGSLFVASAKTAAHQRSILHQLQRATAVEFAEPEARRKLIR
jgi:hypothetical protein